MPKQPKPEPTSANEFVEGQLDKHLGEIESSFDCHAVVFCGPLFHGTDDIFRAAVEAKRSNQNDKLAIVLTTPGGYAEVVQRIVDTLRHNYRQVEFIVPNHAFSAGTVLVMSGDAIHMDYYSRLGPIDPQVERSDGSTVPALGYLERYNDLIRKAAKNKITTAEVQLLISGFDQAELHKYEQARELSVRLLKEWLVKYKFKNWRKTQTRKKNVTQTMKTQQAERIARKLSDTKRWHSHGHGISKDVLERELGVRVDDLESNVQRNQAVRSYHQLLTDYMSKMSFLGVIHNPRRFVPFLRGV